jgi:hypothetical protein
MQKPIATVKASLDIHQGDLILTNNDVFTIENQKFDINGSIIVKENATLILKNATINFLQTYYYQYNLSFQDPAEGNPRLFAQNATVTSSINFMVQFFGNSSGELSGSDIAYYLYLEDSSVISASDSTVEWVVMHDNASLSVINSTLGNVDIYAHGGSPYFYAFNSTIERLMTSPVLLNCSIANIEPGFYSLWDYQINISIATGPHGWAPNVALRNSTVGDWAFWFQNSCNVTMSDSSLYYLRSYSKSICWMINVTANQFQFWNEGRAYVSWYLQVHVVDSISQDVPSANVTAYYPNATVAESKLTGIDGRTRLTLMEKMMNESGEYLIGNYNLNATYETYTNGTEVPMTGNQQVTLKLEGFVVPEFPSFLILPLFMIGTLLAVIVYKRKKPTLHVTEN